MLAEFFPRRLFPSRNLRPSFFAFSLSLFLSVSSFSSLSLPLSLRDQNPFSFLCAHTLSQKRARAANVRARFLRS